MNKNRLENYFFLHVGKVNAFAIKDKDQHIISFLDKNKKSLRVGQIKVYCPIVIPFLYFKKTEGKVYKIQSDRDLYKFKNNYILVTSTLEPKMSVAIANAKGIICDKGGMFYHAATVARKLLIPCLINTKKATKTLKNEDYITMKNDGTIWLRLKK